jgi:hypothetical protein
MILHASLAHSSTGTIKNFFTNQTIWKPAKLSNIIPIFWHLLTIYYLAIYMLPPKIKSHHPNHLLPTELSVATQTICHQPDYSYTIINQTICYQPNQHVPTKPYVAT